jgi:hypothetical protein
MAAFDALERLQKFDWLIQKLHSLRNNFHAEPGLQELQKLHTLQLLQRGDFPLTNGSSSLGESEDDKMDLCKNSPEEEEEEEVFNEEEEEEEEELEEEEEEEEEEVLDEDYDQENMDNEQLMPLALTTSGSVGVKTASPVKSAAGSTTAPSNFRAAAATAGFSVPLPPPPPPPGNNQGRHNGFSGHPPPLRFPTGLFPPLPFEALFSEQEIQVGGFPI